MAETYKFPDETNINRYVRKFSDSVLQDPIEKAIKAHDENAKGAIVAYADLEGVKLGEMGKLGDHWSFQGDLSKAWDGQLEASAEVRFVW